LRHMVCRRGDELPNYPRSVMFSSLPSERMSGYSFVRLHWVRRDEDSTATSARLILLGRNHGTVRARE
jgi:hypothetical protein